jgi:hypothetical protein
VEGRPLRRSIRRGGTGQRRSPSFLLGKALLKAGYPLPQPAGLGASLSCTIAMVNRRLGSGPASRVLHRSIIERFITKQALPADDAAKAKLDAAQIANLTLADLMNDKELGPVVLGSFALVKSDATLADAKNAMDNVSAALGSAGNCYDVFVTDNGKADEAVLGWITNDIINENAKV